MMTPDTAPTTNTFVQTLTNDDFQDELAQYIRHRYDDAFNHKVQNGTEARLLRNLRVKKGVYQPDEIAMLGGIDVYIAISALKSRAAMSWLLDVVLNSIEKPWTLEPSPIPDLPDVFKEQAITMLASEVNDPASGLETMDDVRERATDLKKTVIRYLEEQAKKSTTAMEQVIEEQLDEGNWTKVFAEYIDDLCTYPAAMIRGPIVVQKMKATYKGNAITAESVGIPVVRCISPFDAFPSPTSTTCQDGDYFIEKVRFSRAKLLPLKDVESFDEVNIRRALHAYPDGFQLMLNHDAERDRLEGTGPDISYSTKLLDVLIFNGVIPGKFLIDKGVLVDDPQAYYEGEVWVLGAYVLRAVLNPNPVAKRPIHGTSFAKRNGAFWGDDPISLTYDIQRTVNSAVRALIRNMAYASGPIAEVVAERFSSGEDINQIDPYRLYFVTPDLSGTGQKAISFNKVPSVAQELMPIIERFMKMADDISGIPAYVIGSPQVAGAGRTMGGLSMLMGNAAKGIKSVMLNIDNDTISELIESFYYYNLVTSSDPSIKSDAKVIARGTSGLLQRELNQNKLSELLTLLQPYVQSQAVTPAAIQYLLRQYIIDLGNPEIDIDKIIPDPAKAAAAEAEARQASLQQAAGMGGPGAQTAMPSDTAAPGAQGAISSSAPPPPALPPAGGPPPPGA